MLGPLSGGFHNLVNESQIMLLNLLIMQALVLYIFLLAYSQHLWQIVIEKVNSVLALCSKLPVMPRLQARRLSTGSLPSLTFTEHGRWSYCNAMGSHTCHPTFPLCVCVSI